MKRILAMALCVMLAAAAAPALAGGNNFTILMLGTDGTGASEAMFILAIDLSSGETKLAALDAGTQSPSGGTVGEASRSGGPKQACDAVNQTFSLNVQSYVAVGMERIGDIVDTLGGVTLNVTAEDLDVEANGAKLFSQAGAQQVTGAQALAFMTSLTGPEGAISSRQRRVLTAMMSALADMDIDRVSEAALNVLPEVQTNLGLMDVLTLAMSAMSVKIQPPVQKSFARGEAGELKAFLGD